MAKKDLHKYANAMAYKYRWLDEALNDMAHEIEYVRNEFGLNAARKLEKKVHEGIVQLCRFPHSGVCYENDLSFNGNEVRVLHLRQISVIYGFDNETITLIAIWNNYQNPERLDETIKSRQ